MYDYSRNDSLLCFSYDCYIANGISYTDRITEGLNYVTNSIKSVDDNDLIELNLFYSSQYKDNYVTTSKSGPDSSYNIQLSNGYVIKSNIHNNSALLSLDLYYNQELQDHATVATKELKQELIDKNYTFISTQGYIINTTNIPTLIHSSPVYKFCQNLLCF